MLLGGLLVSISKFRMVFVGGKVRSILVLVLIVSLIVKVYCISLSQLSDLFILKNGTSVVQVFRRSENTTQVCCLRDINFIHTLGLNIIVSGCELLGVER